MNYKLKSKVLDNYGTAYTVTLKFDRDFWCLSIDDTPGNWLIVTLQGRCPYSDGRVGDFIWIDRGLKWSATGIAQALAEAEEIMTAEGLTDSAAL